jgi:hypothetical protein
MLKLYLSVIMDIRESMNRDIENGSETTIDK